MTSAMGKAGDSPSRFSGKPSQSNHRSTEGWKKSIEDSIKETECMLKDAVPSFNASHHRSNATSNTGSTYSAPKSMPFSASAMLDRVLESEQTIQALVNTVQVLRNERSQQEEKLISMQVQLNHVLQRLDERGVDLTTEQKYGTWTHTVDLKLKHLTESANTSFRDTSVAKSQAQALDTLSDELRRFKAGVRKELDSVAAQMSALRTSVTSLQGDVSTQAMHFRHVSAKSDEAFDQMSDHKSRHREILRRVQQNSEEIEVLMEEVSRVRKEIARGYDTTKPESRKTASSTPKRNPFTSASPDNMQDDFPSFETLKRRWARRKSNENDRPLDDLDLTLDKSRIIQRAIFASENIDSDP
eukprot:m.8463 g.8463  ORF g.8463 m.8463 type:complete len:357 (-) comp6872_c0_seq1:92-1162(-)